MERLYDIGRLDTIIPSQSVASTTVTSEYLTARFYRTIGMGINCGTMAVGNTVTLQGVQGTDSNGTGKKNITGATCTVTANTNVAEATATLVTVAAGETIVINGITFTADAATTTVADREFSVAGTDATDATNLQTCINDPVYGVPNVHAERVSNVLTLVATEETGATVTAVGDTHITVATALAGAYMELSTDLLDTANGYDHLALDVTTVGTIVIGGAAASIRARYTPVQNPAAIYLGV